MISTFVTCGRTTPTASVRARRGASAIAPAAALALVVVALQLLQACTFGAPDALQSPQELYSVLDAAPYADDSTVSGSRWRVIDSPKLKVDHGYTCASASRAASKEYIGTRVFDSATLPANFDGTVMMNGWYLEYANGDHHVLGLGSVIFNIARVGNELSWDAGGVLSDHNADDQFMWCYNYTLLAWAKNVGPPIGGLPKPVVDMKAIHADATGKLVYTDRRLGGDDFHTKVAKFKTTGAAPAARLFSGFGVSFKDDDHHVLQFGFDLSKSTIKRKRISWNADVILKDNSDRSYGVGQVATVLTGESVHTWKPDVVLMESGIPAAPATIQNDLQLTPADDANVCLGGGDTTGTYTFKIEGVPFTWAVPMLTGWEVGVVCDDTHVKKIGAWIEDFTWVRNPGDSTGTLRYTVRTIFEDKAPENGIVDGMQVEVLGINLLEPPGNAG
jgi:hypothetical protein